MIDFLSNTPSDVDSLSADELVGLAECRDGLPSPKVRYNYVKMLYDVLGLDLTNDIALASIAEAPQTLVISTAGGGKTTWSQIKAIMQKLYRPSRVNPDKKISGTKILCLVYNKHNVHDMKVRHEQLVQRLRAAGIKGLSIDSDINACTLHSFCETWRREYVARMGLVGYTVLLDDDTEKYMNRAIKIVFKQRGIPLDTRVDAVKLLQFNTLVRETMEDIEYYEGTDKFEEIGLEADVIRAIFERYTANKNLHRKYDFEDMLEKFYDLICTDDKILKNIQRYYEYVIADEVQDFTPLMWAILKKLISNGTPLTAIGDEDQSIYAFRGADIYSTLNFTSDFPDGKVYVLSRNRRCREAILDEAVNVIQRNSLRFDKQLLGVKGGGEVRYVPYSSASGQILAVVQQLQKMSDDDLDNTVVCYRNTANSALLTEYLEENEIPFHIISGCRPFTHELYRHVFHVMNLLEQPYDRDLMINLYKVLPCSRHQIYEVFGFNPDTYTFKGEDSHKHFSQYDYGKLQYVKDFEIVMQQLTVLSQRLNTDLMTSIFPEVFSLLAKYFWNYKKQQNDNPEDELFEKRVIKFFNVPEKYSLFYQKFSRRRSAVTANEAKRAGVTVSTFHSLKGLEFKNVIVIYMENDVFPNFPLIDSHGYAPSYALQLKEAETRLWYVAVTRAKDSLTIYYDLANPSMYVLDALNRKELAGNKCGVSSANEVSLVSGAFESSKPSVVSLQMFDEEFAEELESEEFAEELEGEESESEELESEESEGTESEGTESESVESEGVELEGEQHSLSVSGNSYLDTILSIL